MSSFANAGEGYCALIAALRLFRDCCELLQVAGEGIRPCIPEAGDPVGPALKMLKCLFGDEEIR